MDTSLRRQTVRAWSPYLRPLSEAMQNLEEAAFAVVLTGFEGYRGKLTDLGITRYPILTKAAASVLDAVWPRIPYEVSRVGGFKRIPEDH